MKTYFVQHGLALSSDIEASRPLSEKGKTDTQKVARYLKQRGIYIRQVYHSGKLRAEQTALIFSEELQVNSVMQFNGLKPNDDPRLALPKILQAEAMYVGHLPNIQRLVSTLITGNDQAEIIQFTNSAVACVTSSEQVNHLSWFITPDLCD